MKTKTAVSIGVNEFPILRHKHYMNHAAIAPWPRATSKAVMDFAEENSVSGPEKYGRWLLRETQLKRMLAAMVNASSADDIALLKNTTEGICTVASGIDWRSGDNVVLPLSEFPSNRLPWLALEKLGVEIREVDIRNTNDPEMALIQRMDKRTRLLTISAIQWTDGLRLHLEVLGNACRQNQSLFFVDAIQQLGAMQMDVERCHIDFLAADAHKWMLSAEGIAVFYCREEIREQLKLNQLGWRMVDDPYDFHRNEWQPSRTAARFEAGTPNILGQTAMHASVKLLTDVGLDNIEAMIKANSQTLCSRLQGASNVELLRPFDPHRVSGIVSFNLRGHKPEEVLKALSQNGLVCTVRNNAIRLSPHFYQTGEPLQSALDLIEDTVKNLQE